MITSLAAGPYIGAGTTYKFGNTLLTVPAEFVQTGPGGDVYGAGNWITSLGGIAGDVSTFNAALSAKGYDTDSARAAAGYKIGKFGWLFVLVPINCSSDATACLYNYLQQLILAQQNPQTPPVNPPYTPPVNPPGTQPGITNWFSQDTLIPGIPNWEIVAGGLGAFVVLKKLVK